MRGAHAAVGLLVVALVVATVPAPALADQRVIGSPEISVFSPENQLQPGQETTLPVHVSNVGQVRQAGPGEYVERVTTARGLTFQVRDGDAPIEVTTGQYPVGSVPEGTMGPYDVGVTVAEDAEPGTYEVPVEVRYTYTSMVDYGSDPPEYRTNTRSVTRDLTVEIRSGSRFSVVETRSANRVGGRGNVTLTLRNVGEDPARDASVQLSSASDEVSLGTQSGSSRGFAGVWEPGTNRTFTFATRVSSDAVRREYPLTVQVTYEDVDGIQRTTGELTTGFVPGPQQAFAVSTLSADLHVGEQGSIAGTVRNAGPSTADNAVLVVGESTPNLRPVDAQVALGRLRPGETADFDVDAVIDGAASAGARQLNLTVRYRDEGGRLQVSEPIEPTVSVGAERDWLVVTPRETTFEIDTDNRMTVSVRNRQDVPLRDLQVRLEATEPFSSESTTAFVDRLAPDEQATVAFGVTVADDAVVANGSVALNATAERPDGTSIDAGRYVVPVSVVEGSGPGNTTLFVGGLLVVAVVFAAGWWWLRR